MMRISLNGKRISFSTNLYIEPNTWDQIKQRVKGSSQLIKEYNSHLLALSMAARTAFHKTSEKNTSVDLAVIRDIIMSKNTQATTLLGAIGYHLVNLRARAGHDISLSTAKKV